MTTTKTVAAVVLAASTLLLATGCGSGRGIFGEIHMVSLEVTGTGGQAGEVTYQLPADDGTERAVALPWKKSADSEFAPVSVTAVPAPGASVTCRIVLDGTEVAKATGTGGTPATCRKDKIDS
jgi:hypothetical protein